MTHGYATQARCFHVKYTHRYILYTHTTMRYRCEILNHGIDSYEVWLHGRNQGRPGVNMHFANIGKNLASEIVRNITNDSDFTQYLTAPSLTKCKFRCVTQAEIVQAINKLENKNSFGHDGISNKLLKFIKDEIISSLTLIVNQMITTGIFPDSFKKSKIIPLFKKGEPSLLVNYRPISLLPTISKIFERIIHNQMYDYFNDNNLLAEQQYGFRKLHST